MGVAVLTTAWPPGQRASVIRVPLPGIAQDTLSAPEHPCPRCGSRGFTQHQTSSKRIRDPHVRTVAVARYRCKRCGRVERAYPRGVGTGRQSEAVRYLCALLYGVGLTYECVRGVLAELGCALSITTVRKNVRARPEEAPTAPRLDRLRLRHEADGLLRGPDGSVTFQLGSTTLRERWIEATIDGPAASEMYWRFQDCERRLNSQCD